MTDDLRPRADEAAPDDAVDPWARVDSELGLDTALESPDLLTEPQVDAPAELETDPDSHPDVDLADQVDADVPAVPWPTRAARRVVRRPVDWWQRPWDTARAVRVGVTAASLVTTTIIVMLVVHFNPLSPESDLIFDDTTPTGGDMGAHVWAPAFLRDHFLPNFQLSGWSMDWYGGLPLYRFYMVIPALAIVALDIVLPYGIAFKIVAMSGLLFFPLACWAFGRLSGFKHPVPELFAFGGLAFLLDESFEIYGGNVLSTMAGEYSHSIALTLAVFGLGLLAHGLRTGRHRVWAAVVLSLSAVSHGIVLIFVAVSATVICLTWVVWTAVERRGTDGRALRGRTVFSVTAGLGTLLLSAWWVGPFLLGHEFMNDMKYGFRPRSSTDSFWDMYFPLTPALDILIMGLAVIGFVASIVRRQIMGVALGIICAVFFWLVWNTRDSLPFIGLLWNPRLLPFLYLTRYLLMIVGAYELIRWTVNTARNRVAGAELGPFASAGGAAAIAVSLLLVFGWMYEVLPGGGRVTVVEATDEAAAQTVYGWGPLRKPLPEGDGYRSRSVADGWTRYNWSGYEGRPAYPAYHDLVTTMDGIGDERGCGRALWENNSANSEYGTTMALMLLPHWTDGCIASMEGLFFEATASTAYHFITAAAVSESSSNPVRQLRYTNNDAELGVRHMRDLGVRYLMVRTEGGKGEAATLSAGGGGLTYITTSGTWDIYEVDGSNVIEPLAFEPVVVTHADGVARYHDGDERERNLELGTSWFQRRDDWPVVPVDDGPDQWQRVTAEIVESERIDEFDPVTGEPMFDDQRRRVDYVAPEQAIEQRALPAVEVSNVDIDQQSLSFSVDQVGVPIIVKVSYFPNWQVSGAEGPYRAGANHMVVVPTDTEVELTYDSRSALDWFFYLLTAVGIGLCVVWRRRGDVDYGPFGPVGSDRSDADTDTDAHTHTHTATDTDTDTHTATDAGPDADTESPLGGSAEAVDELVAAGERPRAVTDSSPESHEPGEPPPVA